MLIADVTHIRFIRHFIPSINTLCEILQFNEITGMNFYVNGFITLVLSPVTFQSIVLNIRMQQMFPFTNYQNDLNSNTRIIPISLSEPFSLL